MSKIKNIFTDKISVEFDYWTFNKIQHNLIDSLVEGGYVLNEKKALENIPKYQLMKKIATELAKIEQKKIRLSVQEIIIIRQIILEDKNSYDGYRMLMLIDPIYQTYIFN
jgi:hypothetical protein